LEIGQLFEENHKKWSYLSFTNACIQGFQFLA
jgi:hypothetical protein